MTFQSASHSVLPITFKMFRAFKAFFLTYLRWEIKDNFLSKITPRNLVSSTTGIGLLSRKSCGSKWRPLFWQICIQRVFVFENRKPRDLLYTLSHRQDSTYHGLCYTSSGALAGTRKLNGSMKDGSDNPSHSWDQHKILNCFVTFVHSKKN